MKVFVSLLLVLFFNLELYGERKVSDDYAVVFMYHHFGKDKFPSTNITIKQFQSHLDYLQKYNYNVWPLSKILKYIKNKQVLPENTVALTIDDAYISIFTHAYPMLKKKGFPYTVFVNTSPIGNKSIDYMTWEHMREMQLYGAEFSNHSSTHDYLVPIKNETVEQWKARIQNELENAQDILKKELGSSTNENPKLISYPFGEYTKETAKFIEDLGYIGVTQTSGVLSSSIDLRRVPRFAMSEMFGDMEGFKLKLNTLAFPMKRQEPWNPIVTSNPPKLKIVLDQKIKNIACYTSNGKRIEIKWLSETELEVQAPSPLVNARDRYTCTALDKQTGKYFWYSHLWIVDKK